MSSLSILCLVMPFPVAFVLHDAEEVAVQHRWMLAHKQELTSKFPKMRSIIDHLSAIGSRAFALAATEELVVLLLATCYVLVGGTCCMQIWSALFVSFAVHLLVHVGQSVAVRGYVPGLVTSVLLLPYAAYGVWSVWLAMSAFEFTAWSIAGVAFMVANLRFAHWWGMKIFKKSRQ
ncbi:MAG: HXXEE domain-containing protein [Muribaculaceae bacterium]